MSAPADEKDDAAEELVATVVVLETLTGLGKAARARVLQAAADLFGCDVLSCGEGAE